MKDRAIEVAIATVLALAIVLALSLQAQGPLPPRPRVIPPVVDAWCRVDLLQPPHDCDGIQRAILYLPFGVALTGSDGRGVSIRTTFDGWEVDKSRSQREPFKSFTPAQWEVEITKGRKARDEFRALLDGGTLFVSPVAPSKDIDPWRDLFGKFKVMHGDLETDVDQYAKDHGWIRQ